MQLAVAVIDKHVATVSTNENGHTGLYNMLYTINPSFALPANEMQNLIMDRMVVLTNVACRRKRLRTKTERTLNFQNLRINSYKDGSISWNRLPGSNPYPRPGLEPGYPHIQPYLVPVSTLFASIALGQWPHKAYYIAGQTLSAARTARRLTVNLYKADRQAFKTAELDAN